MSITQTENFSSLVSVLCEMSIDSITHNFFIRKKYQKFQKMFASPFDRKHGPV